MYINYFKLYNIISNQSATDKKQSENFNIWLVLHYLFVCGHLYQSQGENATESRKRALFATISKRTRFAQSQSNAQSANKDLFRLYKTTTTTQHPTKHTQDRRKENQRAKTGAGSGNGQAIRTHPTSTPGAHAHDIGVTPQAQNRRAGGSRSKIGGIISTNQTPPKKNSPKNFQKKIREIYLLVEKIGVRYRKLPRKHFCFVSIGRKTRQKVLVLE